MQWFQPLWLKVVLEQRIRFSTIRVSYCTYSCKSDPFVSIKSQTIQMIFKIVASFTDCFVVVYLAAADGCVVFGQWNINAICSITTDCTILDGFYHRHIVQQIKNSNRTERESWLSAECETISMDWAESWQSQQISGVIIASHWITTEGEGREIIEFVSISIV